MATNFGTKLTITRPRKRYLHAVLPTSYFWAWAIRWRHLNFFPFSFTNFLYPPGGILKTVNKFFVIKSNTKKFDKNRLKQQKSEQKTLKQFTKLCKVCSHNSKTGKMVLERYYCVLNSRLALLNTWNKNTKSRAKTMQNTSPTYIDCNEC